MIRPPQRLATIELRQLGQRCTIATSTGTIRVSVDHPTMAKRNTFGSVTFPGPREKNRKRLETIPGIGVVGATAIAAKGSTGGKRKLGPISKQGDRYLRRILVVGAESLASASSADTTPPAALGLRGRRGRRSTAADLLITRFAAFDFLLGNQVVMRIATAAWFHPSPD